MSKYLNTRIPDLHGQIVSGHDKVAWNKSKHDSGLRRRNTIWGKFNVWNSRDEFLEESTNVWLGIFIFYQLSLIFRIYGVVTHLWSIVRIVLTYEDLPSWSLPLKLRRSEHCKPIGILEVTWTRYRRVTCGWKSAHVITSVSSSIFSGFISTIPEDSISGVIKRRCTYQTLRLRY